jgi:protein-S-isoprenylcysteine O-methyltransferase Ste14
MTRRDVFAAVVAAAVVALFAVGTVYFVQEVWPRLPTAAAVILLILLAAAVIGSPIYALLQWSNRYLERHNKQQQTRQPEHRRRP